MLGNFLLFLISNHIYKQIQANLFIYSNIIPNFLSAIVGVKARDDEQITDDVAVEKYFSVDNNVYVIEPHVNVYVTLNPSVLLVTETTVPGFTV